MRETKVNSQARLLRYLAINEGWFDNKTLSANLYMSKDAVHRTMSILVAAGLAELRVERTKVPTCSGRSTTQRVHYYRTKVFYR